MQAQFIILFRLVLFENPPTKPCDLSHSRIKMYESTSQIWTFSPKKGKLNNNSSKKIHKQTNKLKDLKRRKMCAAKLIWRRTTLFQLIANWIFRPREFESVSVCARLFHIQRDFRFKIVSITYSAVSRCRCRENGCVLCKTEIFILI